MARVLLVENSITPSLRSQLELLRYDVTVDVVETGRGGLEAARRTLPDVIVLDVELPELDGYSVCRSLKADLHTASIPVVLLTPREDSSHMLAAMAAGAVDSIPRDSFAAYNLVEALRQLGVV